jgi:phage baseplate assembly protein W
MDTDIIGLGWPFPVWQGTSHSLAFLGGEEKIRQSIQLILSTAPGERQMRPDFGCGINDLVFAPNTVAVRGLVQQKVREALVQWEPRIDVLDVRVDSPPGWRNYLEIRVDYRIRATNASSNLVYQFAFLGSESAS